MTKSRSPVVLVVEDELLIAMEMEQSLRAAGYDILGPASSVKVAHDLLDGHKPDAGLLDVMLAGETVAPIAVRLQQMKVPYALLTGASRLNSDDASLASAPLLDKPITDGKLHLMVRQLLSLSS